MTKLGLKIFVGVMVAAVVAAIGIGIYLVGSPSEERARRADEQRIQDLQSIASSVNQYYAVRGKLPETLEIMFADVEAVGMYNAQLRDPKTAQPYEYSVKNTAEYTVCAVFETETESSIKDSYSMPRPYPYYDYWSIIQNHGAGRTCFDLRVSGTVGISCDAVTKCPPNYTCASLSGQPAECVLTGTECARAGCADASCIVAESYPVQVRCEQSSQSQCELRRETATGRVECFGCGRTVCKDPAPGWELYTEPSESGYIGIPYACYDDPENGCSLAQ